MAATAAIEVNNAGAVIAAQVANGVNASVASGIVSGAVGGIALGGGSTDYPTFTNSTGSTAAPRSFSRCAPLNVTAFTTGWTEAGLSGSLILGPATIQPQTFLLGSAWNGATLSSVSCAITPNAAHSSLPTILPTISVKRSLINVSGAFSILPLSSTDPQSFTPSPGTVAAWTDSGNVQQLTYNCNQNNVIDTAHYIYYVVIVDENGSGSLAGNTYYGLTLNYTGVAGLAPQ
jgi:hypothetical protein